MAEAHTTFRAARDLLLAQRTDYDAALAGYEPPRPEHFNWALDWFDVVAATPQTGPRTALWVIEQDGTQARVTYAEMAQRSAQVAAWLRSLGVRRGDRVLLMLGNQVELWETMLAATKLGAVIIPATTLLTAEDIVDRIERGAVRHVVAGAAHTGRFAQVPGDYTRIAVGEAGNGWTAYGESRSFTGEFVPDGPTRGDDTLLLNFSSPGWAKHAWSSFFAPWNAEATILVVNQARFDGPGLLEAMVTAQVSTFCAPPTVYRMLIQQDLSAWRDRLSLREMVGAGEPLNPEVIEQVRAALGLTIRDGFGQTETTAQVGNTP